MSGGENERDMRQQGTHIYFRYNIIIMSTVTAIKAKLKQHPHHKDLSNKTVYRRVPALNSLTYNLNPHQRCHHRTLTIPTMLLTALVR